MGEGSGRGSGQTFCRQSRVGSAIAGRVNVSPDRVGSKKSGPWTTLVYSALRGIKCYLKNSYPTLMLRNGSCFVVDEKTHHPCPLAVLRLATGLDE